MIFIFENSNPIFLQLRHNGRDDVSNHWRLDCTQLFQAQINENIKALRHWPLCGEFTSDKRPLTRKMFPFDDEIISREGQYWGTWVDSYLDRPNASEASRKSWIELVTTTSWWRNHWPFSEASDRWALMFSLICARTNGWTNNRDTTRSLWLHCNDHYLFKFVTG